MPSLVVIGLQIKEERGAPQPIFYQNSPALAKSGESAQFCKGRGRIGLK